MLCVVVVFVIQSRFPDVLAEKRMLSDSRRFSTEEEMRSKEEGEMEGSSEEEEEDEDEG